MVQSVRAKDAGINIAWYRDISHRGREGVFQIPLNERTSRRQSITLSASTTVRIRSANAKDRGGTAGRCTREDTGGTIEAQACRQGATAHSESV